MQRSDYWDVISKRVKVYRSDVTRLDEDKVVLEDGRDVKTDVLICGTGLRQDHPYFSPSEAAHLGLPIKLHEKKLLDDEREHWSKLEEETDRKVLERWPYLKNAPKFKMDPPRSISYKLYNLTVPVEDDSIVFLGLMLVPNSYHVALVQTLYAIAILDGALKLPSKRHMEREIAFINRWCARRYS